MNSNTGFLIADMFDILAYAIFLQVTTTEVLNWVYTIVLIISVLFGIVMKIWSAVRDGKITKEEQDEIKKELDEDLRKIDEERKKEDK